MGATARLALSICAVTVLVWWAKSIPSLAAPPSGAHAWRETDGLIVARNYCEEQVPFLEPRVDNRGDTPGRTGLEFPLLNWSSAKLGCASGDLVTPWRVLSFALSILGALSLFFLAFRLLGLEGAALTLAVFSTSPLVPYFSRTTQPDAAAMSLALLALALTQTRARLAAPLALALAMLIKLPASVYGLPVLVLLWTAAGSSRARRLTAALSCLAALVPAALWYRHARALERLDGLTNFGVSRSPAQLWNEWLQPDFWILHFVQRPFDTWVSPAVSALVILVALAVRGRATPIGRTLLLTWLAYLLLCGGSGAYHDYYGLLSLPLAALAGGWACLRSLAWLRARRPALATPALLLFFLVSLAWQLHRDANWWPSHRAEWAELTAFSQTHLGPHGPNRVVVFSDASPQQFWFLQQRGAFGDPSAPTVPPGRYGVVDRLRVPEADRAPLETALIDSGCREQFSNAVAWICRVP